MTSVWRTAVVLASVAALAACSSQPVRPDAPAAGAPEVAPAGAAGNGAVRDNIQLSQKERYRIKHDRGPDRIRADIAQLPEPVPRVEPRSRYGNKSPYEVRGETYRVLATAEGYDERGLASWYGKKFDGYLTSSMERYDMFKFSAASKVLPLPTYARVTNLDNGKSVVVRVNDRGPFVDGRIIDLSYAAAVRIGIWPKGVGKVRVQAIDPAHPGELPPPRAVAKDKLSFPLWFQVGAFADDDNAEKLADRLRDAGLPVQVSEVTVDERELLRVRLGPVRDAAQAGKIKALLQRLGLPPPTVAVD